MIWPKNKKEDLILSMTKKCGMLIKQTHWKAKDTLEKKLSQSRQIFHFNPPISIDRVDKSKSVQFYF